ncbi:inorganic polyphosphate/ATP-NAD kinase [Listeria fleischmannii 1991]|uniref:NAD kinase n=1 Tax=Listeria fleischmannii 1991 TaxID=1430899 RepID=A0A0J8GII0_9LIST|nr:NAD kinase [Listeria fleischmannii]EMG29015.1 inorganic polyphosphate/ATP-NAD kinase [Listeria fleischmannii subsp. fleischmannii LU2006-1]KMT60809.1 inorganic polyphosphate/ATP-NAD kinase [Listeria fleischmannii 1991]
MSKQIFHFSYRKTEELHKIAKDLKKITTDYGFELTEDYQKATVIISIGGDGAFLKSVRETNYRQDCLYAGIALTEQLGQYCDFHIHQLDEIIKAASEERWLVRRYPTIYGTVNNTKAFYVLNEFNIRSSIIRTLTMDLYINGSHFETFRGDGMVISTPTGSTAYNKSVNGSIVDPLLPSMQVSELASLNNNRFRTLGSSFILSPKRKLKIVLGSEGNNEFPLIGMDSEALSIQHVHEIHLEVGDRFINIIKLPDNSFWDKVKRNFL